MIVAAAGRAPLVLVGIGGSPPPPAAPVRCDAIAAAGGLGEARIVCLCDVRTSFESAAETFGPQKGADGEAVARLERRLDELATTLPRDPRGVPMSGGAGGLAGAPCGRRVGRSSRGGRPRSSSRPWASTSALGRSGAQW